MMKDYYSVIMAGGGGTRLWPWSRSHRPKQSLKLIGERTLFQMAVDRVIPIMTAENIFVVTISEQASLLHSQTPQVSEANFLLEPSPRGTASVIGLAAIILRQRDPDCVMANLTADHYIANVERFQELLLAAYEVAQSGELVTLGITPRYPDTGYGYIQRGESIGIFRSFEAFQVGAFKEKPGHSEAEAYLSSGEFAWNSGMFVWKAARILEEMQARMPDLYAGLARIEAALGSPKEMETIRDVWQELENETIDYGIMEGAQRVVVIPADDLGWWDVGGWGRLFELLETDEQGNLILAQDTLVVETKRSLIFQDRSIEAQRFIATLGLDDIVIIDMDDVLFVCHRDYVERVRDLVKSLADLNRNQYL